MAESISVEERVARFVSVDPDHPDRVRIGSQTVQLPGGVRWQDFMLPELRLAIAGEIQSALLDAHATDAAVVAERERCAEVAEDVYEASKPQTGECPSCSERYYAGRRDAAAEVMRKIRERGESE